MQIYNFSLCKDVKDNHLNVVCVFETKEQTACGAETSARACAVLETPYFL